MTLKVGSFGGRYRLGAIATYRCNPGFLLWGNRLMMEMMVIMTMMIIVVAVKVMIMETMMMTTV